MGYHGLRGRVDELRATGNRSDRVIMISYVKGDATRPIGMGPKVIAHICNDRGGWGRGFVVAVSKQWPEPEDEYRKWAKSTGFGLGAVQFVRVQPGLHIGNMVAQEGYGRGNRNPHRTDEPDAKPPIRYDALEKCLSRVAVWARANGVTVHMPRIGCGLAGGRWDEIEPILGRTLTGLSVFVYDL